MKRAPGFVRSQHVVCYWDDVGHVILRNYATNSEVRGAADLCAVVDACGDPRTVDELCHDCRHLSERRLRELVRELCKNQILYRTGRALPAEEVAMRRFGWNPEGGFFHTATKDVVFGDFRVISQPSRPIPPPLPPATRRQPGATLALPVPTASGEFPRVLLTRRTSRRFGAGRIPLEKLAQLLRFTAGMHLFYQLRDGRVPLRTSPSGGARHPIDVYVVALKIEGLRAGIYHYQSDAHRLRVVRRTASVRTVERYLPAQYWYAGAAALVVFAASFERTRARYPYSRAYRAVLTEAGHLCQTFCLTATWLDLAPFCSLAIADSAIERDLDLDGISESALYVAGVGMPHDGAKVSALPEDSRQPAVIRNPAFDETSRSARRGR